MALVASVSLAVSAPAVIDLDGQRVVSDVAPVTAGGIAYLPIRAISEAAGATTAFNPETRVLIVRHGVSTLRMTIGSRRAVLNGHAFDLGHAPFTVHGRAMVRGIDVAAVLGSDVVYDARRSRIDVRTPGAVLAGVNDEP